MEEGESDHKRFIVISKDFADIEALNDSHTRFELTMTNTGFLRREYRLRAVLKAIAYGSLSAIRRVAFDPIGGLAISFDELGARRARAAGIAFGVGFSLLSDIEALIAAPKLGAEAGVKLLFGVTILALVPFAAIAATSVGTRRVLGGTGNGAADVFTAGVALQPAAVLFVLAAIFGLANFQVILQSLRLDVSAVHPLRGLDPTGKTSGAVHAGGHRGHAPRSDVAYEDRRGCALRCLQSISRLFN